MRRLLPLVLAALLVPSPAAADVRLPGPLLALTAGPGSAYAVVSTQSRNAPFRLVRSGGRSARSLSTFGSPGAEFADVAAGPGGSVAVFGRPTSDGFSYELAGGQELGEGTGPPVLALDGATPFAAFPDNDGDAVLGRGPDDITTLTTTGPALRHAPLDVTGGPLVLDLVQSGTRTELRVLGPGAPAAAITSMPGLRAIPATIARDAGAIYVAYRVRNRLTLATARPGGRWSHRRLRRQGRLERRAGRRAGRPPHVRRHEPADQAPAIHLPHHRRSRRHVHGSPHQAARIRSPAARRDGPRRPPVRRLDPPPRRQLETLRAAPASPLKPVVRWRT